MKTNLGGLKIIGKADISAAERIVGHFVTVDINENQFSALVSFVTCRGEAAFRRSVLLRCVNQGRHFEAARQFKLWVNHGGKRRKCRHFEAARQFKLWVNHGGKRRKSLIKRRKAEEKLYLKPIIVVNKGTEYAPPSPL
jgi:GH24 family phage-related lysozyme (muramidase)